jgi:hypothetical protein
LHVAQAAEARANEQPAGAWTSRPVALEAGAQVRLLAGDGQQAAVVYTAGAQPGGVCRLALVDLGSGEVTATHTVCQPRDVVTGLALEATPAGSIAYVAIWTPASDPASARTAAQDRPADAKQARARIVALAAQSGAIVGEAPLSGMPRPAVSGGSLVLAASPYGPALYCVQAATPSVWDRWSEQEYAWAYQLSRRWQLLALQPTSLETLGTYDLVFAPQSLAVSPDGAQAFTLDGSGTTHGATPVMVTDLVTGTTGQLLRLPGTVNGDLAATSERLYAANPYGNGVWSAARTGDRAVRTIPTPRAPTGIAVVRPS